MSEQRAEQSVAGIEDVVDEAVALGVLHQLIGQVDVNPGVAAELGQQIGVIAEVTPPPSPRQPASEVPVQKGYGKKGL